MPEGLSSIVAAIIASKLIIVGLWFFAFFIGERLASVASAPSAKARLIRNGGLWLIVLIISPLIVAPITALGGNEILWRRPSAGEFAVLLLVIDIVLLDLWTYGVHRAYHRVPVLWRFHKVHHFDEFLDSTSAFRFHFGEVIISAVLRLAPIAIFAIPLTHVLVFEILVLLAAIFHHSNLRIPGWLERWLSWVIVTPSIHWVHHHATRADTNSNYATVFSFWDRLFASRSQTKRTRAMKIGVEAVEDQSLLRLILTPFMRSRTR
ncbi:MAG: sterol desaturase family protein [Pseudomonadota bacterium]